ncbi:PREDICTED: uncharacterized protein LOC105450619 [Wasmannia auropunctata]|uniref:uncharacterized protein LOC105450619 n=1 Tax=Wasmannia auropunctata TaxID=64793 RepID=UPI0005F0BFF4|nr:PREDICTED: uncharacterized protein LOC105450619 [Wasmannia auropunctata]
MNSEAKQDETYSTSDKADKEESRLQMKSSNSFNSKDNCGCKHCHNEMKLNNTILLEINKKLDSMLINQTIIIRSDNPDYAKSMLPSNIPSIPLKTQEDFRKIEIFLTTRVNYEAVAPHDLANECTRTLWRLAIKLDIAAIGVRFRQVQDHLKRTEDRCGNILAENVKQMCQNILRIMEKDNKMLTVLVNHLYGLYKPINNKRGLIDAIGVVGKTLFGVMDADDAKLIDEQISNQAEQGIVIRGTGKITLEGNCKLTTQQQIYAVSIQAHLPEFNLTLEQPDEHFTHREWPRLKTIVKNPTELEKLSAELDEINRQLENQDTIVMNRYAMHAASGGVTTVVIISVICVIIYIHKKCKKKATRGTREDPYSNNDAMMY